MQKRGRKSTIDLSAEMMHPFQTDDDGYIQPPKRLNEVQAEMWREIVRSKPASWFGPDSAPLLEQYVKGIYHLRLFTQRLDNPPHDILDLSRLQSMVDKQTKLVMSLATKMRLTQQSRMQPRTAFRQERDAQAAKPWNE